MRDKHTCVVYDHSQEAVQTLVKEGATGAESLDSLVAQLLPPRAVWLMVPAAVVDSTLKDLASRLQPGDSIVDGGNSYYVDDIRRSAELQSLGITYVDVGTSGGIWGLERGYCLMIGGPAPVVQRLDSIFRTLAPGHSEYVPRTPGRTGELTSVEQGYLHCGPSGAGHFVKMVHNGIEYGLMEAYAEGLNILHHANIGMKDRAAADAETTPLPHPENYQYQLDLPAITEVWRRGSVVSSWLLDLIAAALQADPQLSTFSGHVSDSGEGRWTVTAAIDEGAQPQSSARRCSNALAHAANPCSRKTPVRNALRVRRPHRTVGGGRARWWPRNPSGRMPWCSSAPPATWPTRRSSRRCSTC